MDLRERLNARVRARRLDRALADGALPDSSAAMAMRARALVRADTRKELAASIRRITGERAAPVAIGLRVGTVTARGTAIGPDLDRLADRLLEPGPVAPRGVALTQELLTDGAGPLFWAESPDDLGARIRQALEALEPTTSSTKTNTERNYR